MIFLGLDEVAKDAEIVAYCREHGITKTVILSPDKFSFVCTAPNHEVIEWANIIEYRYYYRLLQEIDGTTLVVVNECLRTQNRYDLTYNCMRLFLNQTKHQLIFQYLPLIDGFDDFMVLFDFDTRSRWKREKFRPDFLRETVIRGEPIPLDLSATPVVTDAKTKAAYVKEKRSLIDNIGLKDPHTIPRNLYLMSGKSKLAAVERGRHYVGRNNRFKMDQFQTYRERAYPNPCTVFEFCHNFIDFADFLALSRQTRLEALVSDLKVDEWYLARYREWLGRIHEAYSILFGEKDRSRGRAGAGRVPVRSIREPHRVNQRG